MIQLYKIAEFAFSYLCQTEIFEELYIQRLIEVRTFFFLGV